MTLAMNTFRRRPRTAGVVFLVVFCAYLPGVWWGLPNAVTAERVDVWATDDIAPLAPLTEVYNTFVQAGEDRFLVYPLAHHFLLAAAYAPYLVGLKLSGGFGAPSAAYPFGLADPVTAFRVLTLISRLVSLLMAAGIAVAAYGIARTLWDRRSGILAAAFCAAPYPMFYYAKSANLDVPMLFWMSLGLLAYARLLVLGVTVKRAAALGACAALTAATKDPGAAAFLLMPLALVPMARRREVPGASLRRPTAALLASGLGVYAVASGLIFDPGRWVAHVDYLFSDDDHFARFARFVTWYPFTLSGFAQHLAAIGRALVAYLGPLLLAVAALGCWQSRRSSRCCALLLPAAGYLLIFLLPLPYFYDRFALPLAFLLALFAARGAALLGDRLASRPARALWVAALLAWPLVASGDLTYQMLRDSRYDAERWLRRHASADQTLAHFGTAGELPHLPTGLSTLHLPPGDAAVAALEQARPDIVVILPDWTSRRGLPHSGWCPPAFYQGLHDGTLGYIFAARFKTASLIRRQLLDYPTVNPPIEIFVRERRKSSIQARVRSIARDQLSRPLVPIPDRFVPIAMASDFRARRSGDRP